MTKNEQDGPFEVLRLIMNLRPLNSICVAVTGDTETLPLVSQLMNLELVLTDDLVVSSEDLKAMFYCFDQTVPGINCWASTRLSLLV